MDSHLGSVEHRALHAESQRQEQDLGQILARYAVEPAAAATPLGKRPRKPRSG
jgi:hypothetical protein